MNIREAKQEIIHTVQAYLDKDETGAYTIPPERQRPILLMGPPGIGKTAIMEQVAQECGIGLVSYTITHHTRQSAIGLPFISGKKYGGREYSVTEYTMSEIIAAVYDQIEATGVKEGILFLDEINCVSETLAPTMLQFLQYKTFGTHRIPDGFLIVTAGNPPQYNKSVRDFDIVTLDRLRRIDIEEDFAAFREYASRARLHGAVMAYLGIRNEHFYSIRTEVDGRHFVTARGWEDLSRTMQVHEKKGLPVNESLAVQFLQDPDIARSFAAYYELYRKYSDVYRVPDILEGTLFDDGEAGLCLDPVRVQEMQEAPFDEKLSLIGLLTDALGQSFAACAQEKAVQEMLRDELARVRAELKEAADRGGSTLAAGLVHERSEQIRIALRRRREAGLPVARELERTRRMVCAELDRLSLLLREEAAEKPHLSASASPAESAAAAQGEGGFSPRMQYARIRQWFSGREEVRQERIRDVDRKLTNVFRFLSRVYGEGQEMVLFLTELSAGYYSLRFLNEHGNEAYFRYNRMLLLQDRRSALREEVLRLME